MKIKFYHYLPILLFILLFMVNLACRLSTKKSANPVETIAVSTEAVSTLEAKFDESINQAVQGQKVELSITEEEITSLLAQRLRDQSEIMVSNPQVFLRDGQVKLKGDVQTGKLNIPITVVFEPKVTPDGQAKLELISVGMGPFSAPDSLVTTVQNLADQFLADYIQKSGEKFVVESITVSEGVLTIKGYRP